MNWLLYSLFAMVGFAAIGLIIKQLTIIEPKAEIINFYFFLFTALAFFVFSIFKGTRLAISTDTYKWLIVLAIVAVAANYFSVTAIRLAPNPGYVTGIRAFETVIIVIAAFFLFNSEISATKFMGIILSTCGLILLSR